MIEPPFDTAWQSLQTHAEALKNTRITELFATNKHRFDKFSHQAGNLFLDVSKNKVTQETLDLFTNLLTACDFENKRTQLFDGGILNKTEDRAVLHTALRQTPPPSITLNGQNIHDDITAVNDKMRDFVARVRNGEWHGYSGKPITHIVHIGIGGSHLGPAMVIHALEQTIEPCANGRTLTCDFVSNVDGHDIQRALKNTPVESTLFLIASKTFTTQETMMNAKTARDCIVNHFGTNDAIAQHFVALSSNIKGATDFGISPEYIFGFWDWVGGRYSLWSSIGMPIALMLGIDRFDDLKSGAAKMDSHFKTAPYHENLPVLMAVIGVWNRSFLNYHTHSIAAYDHRLELFPTWLQQTDMESNGKSVTATGKKTPYPTGPMIMGGVGSNVQHSYFQWMHQGDDITPIDFIISARPDHTHTELHKTLISHFIAQQRALMQGIENKDEPHRHFDGDRPSNAVILDQLTPYSLGQLIALYEHKTFVQGILWQINSFDQFGVELGKTMAKGIQNDWQDLPDSYDASTRGQLQHLQSLFDAE